MKGKIDDHEDAAQGEEAVAAGMNLRTTRTMTQPQQQAKGRHH
jgi:hypothetical protein